MDHVTSMMSYLGVAGTPMLPACDNSPLFGVLIWEGFIIWVHTNHPGLQYFLSTGRHGDILLKALQPPSHITTVVTSIHTL